MFVAQSCASQNFTGVDWYLMQLKTGDAIINIDRDTLEADGMGEWFSLRFSNDRVSGMAAPNRYSAEYQNPDNSTIAIGLIASTKMLAFKDVPSLKEHAYLEHLQKVTRREFSAFGYLELSYTGADGKRVTLVFNTK